MPVTPPKSLDEILHEAQTLRPDERVPFILRACETDSGLQASALARLEPKQSWPNDDSIPLSSVDSHNERFGSYRILRSLGQGGMGEVFLAERADDQYRQQVAIKLVRRGLVSKAVQNRLRLERQILATLDHPNIARLLDGGTTADGVPYIVMEYVDGEPIDAYCDHMGLQIAERLRLFMTVCAAVHRAHQNLIVHRDLKPSNILVTKTGDPKPIRRCALDARTVARSISYGGGRRLHGRIAPLVVGIALSGNGRVRKQGSVFVGNRASHSMNGSRS